MTEGRHLRVSVATLAIFLASGLWLEAMIGLRAAGWVDDPLRRELLRLGHAHGGLLSLVSLAGAWAMHRLRTPAAWASRCRLALVLAAPTVGLGFFGGGLWHGPTDPGPLVLVVPAGAMMALAALVAVAIVRRGSAPADQDTPGSES